MLDATTSTRHRTSDSETPVAGPASPVGPRSARKKKRGLFHRTGVVVPALVMAVLLVVGVLVAAKLAEHQRQRRKRALPVHRLARPEQPGHRARERAGDDHRDERRRRDADRGRQAREADPTQILAAQKAAADQASAGSGIQTGTGITGSPPPADPSSAEVIGKDELVAYGFDESTQWPCLYDLWQQESGWNVYAENPSRRLRHPAVAAR